MWKGKAKAIVDYIVKHSKIIFPIFIIAAVAVTVTVALNANDKKSADVEEMKESSMESSAVETETNVEESVVPEVEEDIPMVLNEDSAITTLITTFYNAMASGDTETLNRICDEISIQDSLSYQERAKYIESYPVIEIYTKPGPEEGTTVAFIYYKVIFAGHAEKFPGYTAHYVCTDEQGELYIKRGEISDEANEYIGKIMSQDDVVEFHNRVTVEYNELMDAHPELLDYLSEMNSQVSAAVGVALAQENTGEVTENDDTTVESGDGAQGDEGNQTAENTEQQQPETPAENSVLYATATTTVNVRTSDSQQADKLGKVTSGTKLQVLEQKVNGWSKVKYEGKEGYIKSEYLQVIESADGVDSIGIVTATANLNVRASASENAEKLGVLVGGDSADLLSSENGWCKIRYNGQVGYVKADYVDIN